MRYIAATVFIALLVLPAAAASQSRADEDVPDLEGVWVQKLVTTSISDAPLIGEVTSRTTTFQKMRITQAGTKLVLTEQACDVQITSDQGAVKTHVPDPFVEHMNVVERPGELRKRDSGYYLYAPKKTKHFGVRPLDDGEEVPTSKNDPRVFDQDKDGHPGMTIRLSGLLSGELYMAQQSWDQLWGKVLTNGQIAGPVKWQTDQKVLERKGRIVGEMSSSTPHPDPDQSYFRMVRVDANTTCDEIADKGNSLF
ncbi:MAG: hypothetical protein ACLFVJ_20640 [Persicimonas sp.]